MFKKLAALAGAGAILLAVAAPALAWNWSYVDVGNYAGAVADTGGNSQGNYATAGGTYNSANAGSSSGDRSMFTGSATAVATADVTVGTNLYDCDWCEGCCFSENISDVYVENFAMAEANTGSNAQNNSAVASGYENYADASSGSGYRSMTTGPAYSNASAFTVVNTTLVGW